MENSKLIYIDAQPTGDEAYVRIRQPIGAADGQHNWYLLWISDTLGRPGCLNKANGLQVDARTRLLEVE